MQNNYFSPSINIVRDKELNLNYIPTRNGENAYNKITSAYEYGTRAFNIVGAYGSGKSAFILAFENALNKKVDYFENSLNGDLLGFESEFFIGEYTSFKKSFCNRFKLNEKKEIFDEFKKYYQQIAKRNKGLLIVVDEFGKFLEYAAKESSEEEMYFIQQLAEFVNTPRHEIFFITTLHQSFEDYAFDLSKTQKAEWEKVKGRLIEVSFNEPVEQLLFLTAESLKQKSIKSQIVIEDEKELFDSISNADAFPLRDYFSLEFAQHLFPFDILSASVITLAFQSYGQQERSMFTFLESDDYLGLSDFNNGKQFYSLANCYDYLIYNFHSLLNSRYNPHATQWIALKEALERTETAVKENINDALKIVKTIGLLSIFGRAGQKITPEFISSYSKISLGIEDPEIIVDTLGQKQIIRYQSFNKRYVLFKGTDVNINRELELAEDRISKDFALVPHLYRHFSFPIIQAKRVYYEKGTPRYFTFLLSEKPEDKEAEGSNDGYINLIFNDQLDESKLELFSKEAGNTVLYGWFTNSEQIRNNIIEIEKIQSVKERFLDDIIVVNELDQHLETEKSKLNNALMKAFYGADASVKWSFQGNTLVFENAKALNTELSIISELIYPSTPIFKNELMNRERVSGAISGARKKLIGQLINHSEVKDLNFDLDKYPPERSIYLSLLKETGIHQLDGNKWISAQPSDESFLPLWSACEAFLDGCAIAPRKLEELIDLLKHKPFKLKQGFIDFWVPIFLIAKQNHFTFFENDIFIPQLTDDTIDVAMRQPQKYFISTYILDETRINIFNSYRYFLNQIEEKTLTTETFVETIKPFMVFYNRLVPFTQQTRNLSKDAHRLRDAIANASNPEKIFFEEIPRALGFTVTDMANNSKLEEFVIRLRNATQELSASFESLVNRIEDVLNETVGDNKLSFPANKLVLQNRFKKIRIDALTSKHKVLILRINTPLEDRKSWINSIATVIINKSLDKFTDDDEKAFQIRFPQLVHELDNLTEISKGEIDEDKEEVLKFEITTFVKGVQKNLIRMPKNKSIKIDKLAEQIKPMLNSKDKQANIALLIKLLQEEINND